jgi:hypothetical protein
MIRHSARPIERLLAAILAASVLAGGPAYRWSLDNHALHDSSAMRTGGSADSACPRLAAGGDAQCVPVARTEDAHRKSSASLKHLTYFAARSTAQPLLGVAARAMLPVVPVAQRAPLAQVRLQI